MESATREVASDLADGWGGRTSWYVCDQCKQPHTRENPLVRARVVAEPRVSWSIHAGCFDALQESCIPGVILKLDGAA